MYILTVFYNWFHAATTQAVKGDGSGTEKEGIAKQLCSGWLYHDMNYWGWTSLCEYHCKVTHTVSDTQWLHPRTTKPS